jgi:hypothetical protein
MPETKLPYGKPVKLLIDFQGFPDGRLVLFQIWRKKGGKEAKVNEVYGVTKGGKGVGRWVPLIKRKEVALLEEKTSEQAEEEKYYFIAKIDEQETKSGDMVFTYPIDIQLKTETGKPLNEAKCTITFSDGSKETGVFKNGQVKFQNSSSGKFKIEVNDYTFVFES